MNSVKMWYKRRIFVWLPDEFFKVEMIKLRFVLLKIFWDTCKFLHMLSIKKVRPISISIDSEIDLDRF
jgi:hypothetical protein